jgi:hypothetical protein
VLLRYLLAQTCSVILLYLHNKSTVLLFYGGCWASVALADAVESSIFANSSPRVCTLVEHPGVRGLTSWYWHDLGVCEWLIRRVLDWMIRFINISYTPLRTTGNYSATADLHTLKFTVAHALEFTVFASRILATDSWSLTVIAAHYEVFFTQPNSFLATSRSSQTVISRTRPISWQLTAPLELLVI